MTQIEAAFGLFIRLLNENGNDRRFHTLVRECRKRFPKLADELVSDPIALLNDKELIVKFGPISKNVCELYSAKLGFAFYFDMFHTPLPESGATSVGIFTNFANENQIAAMSLLDNHLKETKTLGQGKFSVADQFAAQIGKISDAHGIGFRAHFHSGIYVIGYSVADKTAIPNPIGKRFYCPGLFDMVHTVP